MPTLIHHPDTHRLGKQDAKPPRMMIRDYVDVEKVLHAAPTIVDNSHAQSIALAMYLNDAEGDCTIAGIGNTLRVNSKGAKQITDQDVQTGYVAVTGEEGAAFNPSTGANDNGCVELDVLDYWVNVGVGGDKLLGHAGVNMTDLDEARAVLSLFGSIYPGWQLDVAQQSQTVWDYVTGSSIWGGHCAPIFDRVPIQALGGKLGWMVGTWGGYKACTDQFVVAQADEGHALITDAWVAANEGNALVNTAALVTDLAALTPEK